MRAKICAFALGSFVWGTAPVSAGDTGLAGIHSWRQVAGRTCFEDHFHEGAGTASTQRGALNEAIKSWISFTELEYGSDWGSYSNSIQKSATCERGMSDFTCRVMSIPCKGGIIARKERKPLHKRKLQSLMPR